VPDPPAEAEAVVATAPPRNGSDWRKPRLVGMAAECRRFVHSLSRGTRSLESLLPVRLLSLSYTQAFPDAHARVCFRKGLTNRFERVSLQDTLSGQPPADSSTSKRLPSDSDRNTSRATNCTRIRAAFGPPKQPFRNRFERVTATVPKVFKRSTEQSDTREPHHPELGHLFRDRGHPPGQELSVKKGRGGDNGWRRLARFVSTGGPLGRRAGGVGGAG